MAVLTRSNYIPNTLIQSAAVNIDFNQLVDLLSGVSTTKDALIKFSNAADPVLRLDQLGAGIIQRWLQNGTEKARVNNDGSFNLGTPGGSPTVGLIAGPDSSGTNIAGVSLIIAGGKGTGNAEPGAAVVHYPLRGASGTTLQSLSANAYPVNTALYTLVDSPVISNTASETSFFTGSTPSAGSTVTIEAGIAKVGAVYRVTAFGNITNTGTPTLQVKVKLGGTTIADTTATTLATITGVGHFWLDFDILVTVIGASGSVTVAPLFRYSTTASGALTVNNIGVSGTTAIDFTAAQALDVTIQWGTANAANAIELLSLTMERIR